MDSKKNDNLEAQLVTLFHNIFDNDSGTEGTISDLGDVVGGATPSTDNANYFCSEGIPWLSPKDLTSTGLKFIYKGEVSITQEAYNSCSTKLMPPGTVLLTSRAPVGTVGIAMNKICTNQGFKSVVPKSSIGTAYIYYFLKENKQLLERHASGTTFMEISGNVLRNIPAIIPEEQDVVTFRNLCRPLFASQQQIELEIQQLKEMQRIAISSISCR